MKSQEITGRLFLFFVLFVLWASVLSFIHTGDIKAVRKLTVELQQNIDKSSKVQKWLVQRLQTLEKQVENVENSPIYTWIVE